MRRAAVLVTAVLAVSAVAAGAPSAEAHGLRAAQAVQASINILRAQHGCGPLRTHQGLARSAGKQARLLLADGDLDHDAGSPMAERLHRAAPSATMLGEDLAWGSGSQAEPEAIVQAWLESPEHRRIMLDCRFSWLGVGVAAGQFGDVADVTVYAADFAA